MNGLEITKSLKNDIEENQIQLQNAIRNHQSIYLRQTEPEELIFELKEVEKDIIHIGIKQKILLERLREEYKAHQKAVKNNVVKTAIEERRANLSTALNRARKQNFQSRSHSSPSYSDESDQQLHSPPPPEEPLPVFPHDISQSSYLSYFRLATHKVCEEMLNKRAERKRRSTANPHFVYGNRGWDLLGPPTKRKRNNFLAHPPSPPNTRGRKKQEKAGSKSPPNGRNGNPSDKGITNGNSAQNLKPIVPQFPSIPNLPSGLVIERVSSGSSSPDPKQCIVCKQPGALTICEQCFNGFHMSCHNRPFARTPKDCPKCLQAKEGGRRSVTSSESRSAPMTISYVSPTEISEKLHIKQELEEKHGDLVAELTQLQNRHSELTISLKNQEMEREQLRLNHETTEAKVDQLIKFVETVKNFAVPEKSNS